MDGNNSHGYLQEDVNYDDLIMNGTGWPGSTDQFAYQQPQSTQESYASPYSNPPSFEHFDLHQQSYPSATYANSPYTAQSQYQHAKPSDVFGPTSYNLDPALHSSNGYSIDTSFSFSHSHHGDNNTISPQDLQQYQMASAHTPINRGSVNGVFQPSTTDFNRQPQDPAYLNNKHNGSIHSLDNSTRYPTLPSGSSIPESNEPLKKLGGSDNLVTAIFQPQDQPNPVHNGLRITHPELHAANNLSSRPRFQYAPFLSWEDSPIQVAPGLKNTLPKYHSRKSRSGKELVPGLDIFRSSTLARTSAKKIKPKTSKEAKPAVHKYKGTSQGLRLVHDKLFTLRNDDTGSAKLPSTPTETSSEEEESSSEEESEYEEDVGMLVKDISEVRPATRPTDVAAAAGWDAIGIIWKDPNSSPNADIVKGAIEEYGNFVSALRVQLKTNSTQTEEAASRPADVDRLRRARQVLLESLYQTIIAANALGYPAIVENLGSHQKLVNGLTTTLIECIKTEDFSGKLPKAVFSLLAKFQNMSDALLKKLKFDSITKRWNKKGDDETKKDIASILANTIEAKERATKIKKEVQQVGDAKSVHDKIEQTRQKSADSVKAVPNLTNPAKRPHDGDGSSSKPTKKFASDVAGVPSSVTSKPLPSKRPTNTLANNLLGISSKPAAKLVSKRREPSPPTESKLGALLAQIAEPIKPPKSPEAKPLPPETPEQRKRRERKESRRHLRVKFRDGPDLEEIRLFKHEQAEDEGRQDDMLRDFGDERSEGMMHKQRVSESMDFAMDGEDDDYDPENVTFVERPYPSLVGIDFSDLDKTTNFGPTYATRGGEKIVITPEQQAQERREALELMVVYTDPKDIPSSPKEPPHGETGFVQQEQELKGPNEPWVVQRLQEAKQYGPEYASQILQQRKLMSSQHTPISANYDTAHQHSVPPTHISSLNTMSPSNIPQVNTHTINATALENLQLIVNSLKGKPFPPTEPPEWMTNLEQRAEWWDGYNKDNSEKVKEQADAQIAQLRAQYQAPPMISPEGQLPMHPVIINPFPAPAQPNTVSHASEMTQQVQAYLNGIQAGSSTNNSASIQQQYDFNGWTGGNNGHDREYDIYDQPKRWDTEREKESTRAKKKQAHNKNNHSKDRGYDMKQFDGGQGHANDALFDENGEYKGKKKPCRFWQEGKCAKGAKCTYLHDERT